MQTAFRWIGGADRDRGCLDRPTIRFIGRACRRGEDGGWRAAGPQVKFPGVKLHTASIVLLSCLCPSAVEAGCEIIEHGKAVRCRDLVMKMDEGEVVVAIHQGKIPYVLIRVADVASLGTPSSTVAPSSLRLDEADSARQYVLGLREGKMVLLDFPVFEGPMHFLSGDIWSPSGVRAVLLEGPSGPIVVLDRIRLHRLVERHEVPGGLLPPRPLNVDVAAGLRAPKWRSDESFEVDSVCCGDETRYRYNIRSSRWTVVP